MSTELATDETLVETPGLSERDRAILAFERQWWKHPGAKESKILEQFGMSATRFYQVLNAIIDQPAALEVDPMTVRRLLRLRDQHRRARRGQR